MIEVFSNNKYITFFSIVIAATSIGFTVSLDPKYSLVWIGILCFVFLYKKTNFLFFLFIFISVGLGPSFNLTYRINVISLADISIVLFITSWLLTIKENELKLILKDNVVKIFMFFLLMGLIIGVLNFNSLSNIFQDFKLYMYLFFSYIYIRSAFLNQTKFPRHLLIVAILCSIVIVIQEILHVRSVGLQTMMSNNFSNRDVGISVQLIPIISVILLYLKLNRRLKINIIFFTLLQFGYITAVVFSFTRTIWIQYLLSIIVLLAVLLVNKKVKSLYRLVLISLFLGLLIWILIISNDNSIINDLKNVAAERFLDLINYRNSYTNTLDTRILDSNLLINYISNEHILWGNGMGDTFYNPTRGYEYTFAENSFLYWTWKYGLFMPAIFFISIFINLILRFKNQNSLYQLSFLLLFVFITIGNFSGNINLYYFMPLFSFFIVHLSVSKSNLYKEEYR